MEWLRASWTKIPVVLALCIGLFYPAANADGQLAAAKMAGEESRFKGVFEPVNYDQDIKLTDVFFTSADEGWVSGDHATILHTVDGGKTWTAQVGGDPSGNEKSIGQLRFLDARHGWAVTDDSPQRLLRTMDGKNWDQIGEGLAPGSGFIDYAFTSVRHGLALGGNMGGFYVTDDGGRHWQNVGPCQITVRIQGLSQTQTCYPLKLQMLSGTSGLAFTSWRSPEAPNATSLAIFRTNNGGQSWGYVVPPFHDNGDLDIFFTDLNHGVAVFDNRTYITADGGRNWHALLSGGAETHTSRVRFADPEIGWSLGNKYPGLALSYTTDGGQHWKTFEPLRLPANPNGKELSLSFPRRDRAYIVGPHGMIYRYSIVPASYSAASASPGPLMPGLDTAQLTAAANRVRQDIAQLQQQIAAASGGTIPLPSGPPANAAGTKAASAAATPASASAGFTESTSTPGTAAQQAPPASDTSGTGAFVQDTAAAAAFSSDPTNANLTQGFTQSVDTSTPSAPLQSCCAPALQSLQTNLAGFNQSAAMNSTQFRSLNLIIAGVQFVSNLLNQTQQLRASFTALKRAPTLQAASGVLQQLAATINSTQQSVSTGFQNQGGWFASNAPASFVQDVGTGAAGMASATPGGAAGTFSAAAPGGGGFTSGTVGPAAANASTPQQGVAFAAVVQGGTSAPLTMATAQVVSANAKSQDLNALAADNAVLQSLQQGATGAVQQAASGMSSAAASSLSSAAGGLVGGVFKKRNPAVVYLWGLPNSGSAASAVSNQPSFQINFASIPGVNASDYAPALVRLVPAQNGWFLVGAAKGQAGALQSSSPDWDLYSSFSEQRVPAQVSQTAPGQATVHAAQALAPGPYAIVLRPAARNKKFSGADLAGLQGDGLAFNTVWPFVVSVSVTP